VALRWRPPQPTPATSLTGRDEATCRRPSSPARHIHRTVPRVSIAPWGGTGAHACKLAPRYRWYMAACGVLYLVRHCPSGLCGITGKCMRPRIRADRSRREELLPHWHCSIDIGPSLMNHARRRRPHQQLKHQWCRAGAASKKHTGQQQKRAVTAAHDANTNSDTERPRCTEAPERNFCQRPPCPLVSGKRDARVATWYCGRAEKLSQGERRGIVRGGYARGKATGRLRTGFIGWERDSGGLQTSFRLQSVAHRQKRWPRRRRTRIRDRKGDTRRRAAKQAGPRLRGS